MRAGRLRSRCVFEQPIERTDEIGNAYQGWEPYLDLWGDLRPTPGREAVAAGRLESAVAGTLRIRASQAAAGITTAMRVKINDTAYAIRSIIDPDMKGTMHELLVERGVAA